jgi:hypothetical protein
MAVTCAGTAYCDSGELCCMAATTAAGKGTTSCQSGTTCPQPSGALLGGEFCESDSDCQNGAKCTTYNCIGNSLTACAGSLFGTVSGLCTKS